MQTVVVSFKHCLQDTKPYWDAVIRIRQLLSETGAGEYVEDDMAIDGGDAEAILMGESADEIYSMTKGIFSELPFMKGAQVRLIYGPDNGNSPEKTIEI